jgi:hypothetical protein
MPTEISGSTGVNKIQDGTVVAGDLASSVDLGKVLQVVENVYSTAVSSGTTSMVDTGLTATITPSSTSSKILVMVNQPLVVSTDTTSSRDIAFNICRGSTEILAGTGAARNDSSHTQRYPAYNSLKKLDSPNTTSATTYKTQFKLNDQQADIHAQQYGGSSTMILMEIAG